MSRSKNNKKKNGISFKTTQHDMEQNMKHLLDKILVKGLIRFNLIQKIINIPNNFDNYVTIKIFPFKILFILLNNLFTYIYVDSLDCIYLFYLCIYDLSPFRISLIVVV